MARYINPTFYDDDMAEIGVECDAMPGEVNTRLLPITYSEWLLFTQGGRTLSEAFPRCSPDELELPRSGMTQSKNGNRKKFLE